MITTISPPSTLLQLKDLYLTNQLLPEPYNIYLCNFDETDEVAAGLLEAGGGDCPWNVSSKCFSDLFPRENLVYMTPDSPHLVSGHRFDDIFILGACVDVLDPDSAKGISYAKAQRRVVEIYSFSRMSGKCPTATLINSGASHRA